jgi:hypothetical protein
MCAENPRLRPCPPGKRRIQGTVQTHLATQRKIASLYRCIWLCDKYPCRVKGSELLKLREDFFMTSPAKPPIFPDNIQFWYETKSAFGASNYGASEFWLP